MRLSADYQRAWLRWVYANRATATLSAALSAQLDARVSATAEGRFLSATSAAGHSVTFALPAAASQTDIAELASAMLDRYDASRSALVAAGVSDPADSAILTEMLYRTARVCAMHSDFADARTGVTA